MAVASDFPIKSEDFSLIMRPKYGKFNQLNYLTTHPHRCNKRQNKCREIQACSEDFSKAGRGGDFFISFKEDLRVIMFPSIRSSLRVAVKNG